MVVCLTRPTQRLAEGMNLELQPALLALDRDGERRPGAMAALCGQGRNRQGHRPCRPRSRAGRGPHVPQGPSFYFSHFSRAQLLQDDEVTVLMQLPQTGFYLVRGCHF